MAAGCNRRLETPRNIGDLEFLSGGSSCPAELPRVNSGATGTIIQPYDYIAVGISSYSGVALEAIGYADPNASGVEHDTITVDTGGVNVGFSRRAVAVVAPGHQKIMANSSHS